MAAYEPYDDAGLPVTTSSVAQTLTLAGRGGVTVHTAKKRVQVNKSADGVTEERINFSGSNTEWYFSIPYGALTQADAGTIMQYWVEYGVGALESFMYVHSDGHTYVVRFEGDYAENWKGRIYSTNIILRILGKITDV